MIPLTPSLAALMLTIAERRAVQRGMQWPNSVLDEALRLEALEIEDHDLRFPKKKAQGRQPLCDAPPRTPDTSWLT